MAVKDGLPATDFSKMNRDYIRNVAEGETVKDGLPATDFSRMNREYIKAVVEESGGGGGSITVEELNVTENNTYTAPEGKAYSPVIVNVSGGVGGDLSLAEVTLIGNFVATNTVTLLCASIEEDSISVPSVSIDGGTTTVIKCILYKGQAVISCDGGEITASSGNVTVDPDNTEEAIITGDCSLTIDSY